MPSTDSNPLPIVLLAATDSIGLDALRPTGEMLDAFGIGWEQAVFPPCAPFPRLERTWRMVIAASGDARLPAALAECMGLPVVRVPVPADGRSGLGLVYDETGNLPAGQREGEAFATVAIGEAGAKNAALFVVAAVALTDARVRERWHEFRERQTEAVLQGPALKLED